MLVLDAHSLPNNDADLMFVALNATAAGPGTTAVVGDKVGKVLHGDKCARCLQVRAILLMPPEKCADWQPGD